MVSHEVVKASTMCCPSIFTSNLTGNSGDQVVIDTTANSAQVFNVLDGATIEVFLQYGKVTYIAICQDKAIRLEVVSAGKPMVGIHLPPDYNRQSWVDSLTPSGTSTRLRHKVTERTWVCVRDNRVRC